MLKTCRIDADVEAAFIQKLEDRVPPQVCAAHTPTRIKHPALHRTIQQGAYTLVIRWACSSVTLQTSPNVSSCTPAPRQTRCSLPDARHTVFTPYYTQDGTSPLRVAKAASSSTGKKGVAKKDTVSVTLDSDWVLEHALEVAQTLPGGVWCAVLQWSVCTSLCGRHRSSHPSRPTHQGCKCSACFCGRLRAVQQLQVLPSALC